MQARHQAHATTQNNSTKIPETEKVAAKTILILLFNLQGFNQQKPLKLQVDPAANRPPSKTLCYEIQPTIDDAIPILLFQIQSDSRTSI